MELFLPRSRFFIPKSSMLLCLLAYAQQPLAQEFYWIESVAHTSSYSYQVTDRFGDNHQIAAYQWSNDNSRLVLMAHGYLDNCAYLKPLQRWFLSKQIDVLCLELPGHGSSSGERGDISSMYAYLDIYKNIFPRVFELDYESVIFYGHSTGTVGMIEYLLDANKHEFTAIVMSAPLIRSYLWNISKLVNNMTGWILDRVPRRRLSFDDPEYDELVSLDPSYQDSVPLHWFEQLIEWNEILETDDRISREGVHVIFAEKDRVISNSYNRRFIEERFPEAQIDTVANSGHVFHFSDNEIRAEFYAILEDILQTE